MRFGCTYLLHENLQSFVYILIDAENIVGTADSSTSITVQWTRPTKLFDTLGENTTASNGYTVETW